MERSTRRILAGAGVGLPLMALGARLLTRRGSTPPIQDEWGRPQLEGIASLERVRLGGVDQWLLMRGRSVHNPLLLYLSDGPGCSEMAFVRRFNAPLEEHFLVVQWDQRGAARSYAALKSQDELTLEQFVSDASELLELLTSRFSQEKVFLVGHGWGSILGVLLAQRRPERLHAYIGTGQRVNFLENDTLSHLRAYELALRYGDTQAIERLKRLGPPPYTGPDMTRRYLTLATLASHHTGRKNASSEMLSALLKAPEYSLRDKVNFFRGPLATFPRVYPQLADLDLEAEVPRLEVPVWFLLGREDYVTPSEIAARYFDKLEASRKTLLWFEHSGHSPLFEEPEKFNAILDQQVRALLSEERSAEALLH
ncbi:alpha/beta fold hydrolase [Vitiosangium sp. GDMCC 1.1324]|uniref:alpha/beta fold hydrolase n=1 Tax=Vitiosangium sp. (strain GDMCC 1.1324) TaxID=2138576 RepID=UPI000D3326D7|nr:alpha/beta hydrolase [Vitiosangium sp. GDMCC 1.1324]PTL84573.1 alpha/beta hydrolase [Vitiosangium sp. GDMCC 1.1324]